MKTIVGLALAALSAVAESRIHVEVRDTSGAAVDGARVELRQRLTGQPASCVSGAGGRCEITVSAVGAAWIVARKDDFAEAGASLEVKNGDQEVTLTVRPGNLHSAVSVVSGSRVEELQEDSPVKVDVITRRQIQATGDERVSDVLGELPGVVTRRSNTATVGGEQIQGVDSRQVLVLQDGLPVLGARGIKSGAINLNRQSVGRMDRVEVAKGAGSSSYGSDAIGGVVNMITREPKTALEGGVSLSGGSLGAVDFRGDVGGKWKSLTAFLNLETHRQDEYSLIPGSVLTVGPQFRRNDLLFKTRYQFTPSFALGFTANAYHNREEGRNASETGNVAGLANDSTQSYAIVADYIVGARTTVQARAYAARYDENSVTTAIGRTESPALANLNERLKRLDATVSHQLGGAHFLQGGAEWAQTLYRGANRLAGDNIGQQVRSTDYWVQDKWRIGSRLTANFGGRVTQHSLFGNAAVPKVGLVYRLNENWIARASWGLGFRAPDLGQLYFRFANPASFYQVIGNPNLRPEHSASFQSGVLYRSVRLRLGVSLYRNQIRDLIDSRVVGTPRSESDLNAILAAYSIPPIFSPLLGRQTFLYLNVSKIYTQGFEVDGEISLRRNWTAGGAYNFLNAVDDLTKTGLPQRHRHHGFVKTDYRIPKWGVVTNLRGTFFSEWLLNQAIGTRGLPYQLWDFYIAKDFRRGFNLFAAIDNLNNSRDGKLALAAPAFDRPDYGRTWRTGMRWRFQGGE